MPLIGRRLIDAINGGGVALRPALCGLHPGGAHFAGGTRADYDVVLLATGYRPSLKPLADVVARDPRGFAVRRGRVASAEHRGLFFVGHSYDARGGLYNIRIDSRLAARAIAARVAA